MQYVQTCVVVTLKVKGNAAALGGQRPPTHFLPRLRGLEKTLHSDCQSYLTAAAFRRYKESCNFRD